MNLFIGLVIAVVAVAPREITPKVYSLTRENCGRKIEDEFFRLEGFEEVPFRELPATFTGHSPRSRDEFTILPTTRTVIAPGFAEEAAKSANKMFFWSLVHCGLFVSLWCIVVFSRSEKIQYLCCALILAYIFAGLYWTFSGSEPQVWFDNGGDNPLVVEVDSVRFRLPARTHRPVHLKKGIHMVVIQSDEEGATNEAMKINVNSKGQYFLNIRKRNTYELNYAHYIHTSSGDTIPNY